MNNRAANLDLLGMKRGLFLVLIPFLFASFAHAQKSAPNEWKEESNSRGVLIQSRAHEGSPLREFRAIGRIEAAPSVVFAVLNDSEAYPSFMPYTSECRVLKREKDAAIVYQRLDLPLMSSRDYTLRSQHTKMPGPNGASYRIHWLPANDQGPAVKPGVVRVNVCDGGWLLEPEGANATHATYSIFTDSGGALPAFIANNGSRIGIRRIFEAVRKQVKNPKYSAAVNGSESSR